MRRFLLLLSFLLLSTSLGGQTPVYLAWDVESDDISAIVRHELKIDNGTYTNLGVPPIYSGDPNTLPGHFTYFINFPNVTTTEDHTFIVRLCTADSCTPDSDAYRFTYVGKAKNVRPIKK